MFGTYRSTDAICVLFKYLSNPSFCRWLLVPVRAAACVFSAPCSQMCGAVWEGGLELQPAHSHLGITQSYNQHFLVNRSFTRITSYYGSWWNKLRRICKIIIELCIASKQWSKALADQIWFSVISDIYHSYLAAPLALALKCFYIYL